MLDLFDKHEIKVSSFMIGQAVDKHPELASEIVRRGHEAAAHGRLWQNQYLLGSEQERAWGSVHTLELLQELGFSYHIDDLSADEPFIQPVVERAPVEESGLPGQSRVPLAGSVDEGP
jgi:peptidoglycan/xylan/chitin deacetylase (PgdA/CDA1 family)